LTLPETLPVNGKIEASSECQTQIYYVYTQAGSVK